MSYRKSDKYYRSDGAAHKKFAQSNNRIAEMLRSQKPADTVPPNVVVKEYKK
jgi:hypothetical protein